MSPLLFWTLSWDKVFHMFQDPDSLRTSAQCAGPQGDRGQPLRIAFTLCGVGYVRTAASGFRVCTGSQVTGPVSILILNYLCVPNLFHL